MRSEPLSLSSPSPSQLPCDDLMTRNIPNLRLRPLVERMHRRAVIVVALAIVIGSLVLSGSPVRADQTVYFDDASEAPHISVIGDSTLAGVRWYADYGALERFNFVFSAESCRRTIEQSCISREGYRSANVLAAMRSLDGELGEVLVVMSGYNDPVWTIDEAIAGVVDEARRQGVRHVVWLSLRTSEDVDYSDPQEQSSIDSFREYNEQLVTAAADSGGFLQVADWATYSNSASGWFEADGVHLTPRGVDAVTTFTADTVERVLEGDNVTPSAAPWTVLVPGARGETVATVQAALVAAGVAVRGGTDGVFGNDTMVAVAEYQRRTGVLEVTGAVDAATARMLGVYPGPRVAGESAPTTSAPAPNGVAATRGRSQMDAAAPFPDRGETSDGEGRSPGWLLLAAPPTIVLAAVVSRRRYVTRRRAARRWARVHPSTSPNRSVADMRRTGELRTRPGAPIYDRRLEEPMVGEFADAGSH
jgi:peptidoglycan hydrolase-like protein with peptidoglycan-binding domain